MPEDTPVEIHVYGLRYKPGKVLVYETYTRAGSVHGSYRDRGDGRGARRGRYA